MLVPLFQSLAARIPKHRLFRWLGVYPPYLGAGIRVTEVSEDLTRFAVEMPLHRLNQNYVGTQFGGSLYSLADPWFMFILMENLGSGYVVWDKAAAIRFKKPGRGRVRAVFEISRERIAAIRAEADANGKTEPEFSVAITDEKGETVAEVDKRLYVRRKG